MCLSPSLFVENWNGKNAKYCVCTESLNAFLQVDYLLYVVKIRRTRENDCDAKRANDNGKSIFMIYNSEETH